MNYKEAGVDVEAGYKAVELMKEHVKTHIEMVWLMTLEALADCSLWQSFQWKSRFSIGDRRGWNQA